MLATRFKTQDCICLHSFISSFCSSWALSMNINLQFLYYLEEKQSIILNFNNDLYKKVSIQDLRFVSSIRLVTFKFSIIHEYTLLTAFPFAYLEKKSIFGMAVCLKITVLSQARFL